MLDTYVDFLMAAMFTILTVALFVGLIVFTIWALSGTGGC